MTTRIHALTVVLDDHIREDDAEALIAAILQLRGVFAVTTHVSDGEAYAARYKGLREMQVTIEKAMTAKFLESVREK